MPTDTEVEEKMRQLEAEVRATRAANPPPRPAAPLPQAAVLAPTPARTPAAPPKEEKQLGFFGRLWSRQTWKTKLVVVAGTIVAGAITLWVAGKILKLALYVGGVAAVAYGIWWFLRKKKS